MNSKTVAKSTDLMCSNCGYILVIFRQKMRHKQPFHIKDLWCPVCKMETKFIEIKDRDIMYYKLLDKKNKSELEKYVFDVLESRRKDEKGYSKQLGIRE